MKKNKNVVLIVLLSFVLVTGYSTFAYGAESLGNFTKTQIYNNQFIDVPSSMWFCENVATEYEYGLMKGTSSNVFNPYGNLTIAETITLAARIHSIYSGDGEVFVQGSPWYYVYIDYCADHGIIPVSHDVRQNLYSYESPATRAQFAAILAAALPSEALGAINTIERGSIPDVYSRDTYYDAVYKLYRAGILTGNDSLGTFDPDSTISRSEVAAIVTRMAVPSLRKYFTLGVNPNILNLSALSLSASKLFVSLLIGESENIKLTYNNPGLFTIYYNSGNPYVAYVSDIDLGLYDGSIKITGLSAGSTYITITNSLTSESLTIYVTVTDST